MKGYDREDAARAIAARINARAYSDLGIPLDALVRQAIDADLEYMKSAGVLTEDGTMGDAYYDDDDAFEFCWTASAPSAASAASASCA